KHGGMKNMNVLVKEEGDHITFLHKVVEGTADKSYGIQVAKLAGFPKAVVERAKQVYEKLEMVESDLGKLRAKKPKNEKTEKLENRGQVSLF
ncbi:DNA mismatch repair protein MutS, partial [Candidatus Margulisiibacteriota bacterium]